LFQLLLKLSESEPARLKLSSSLFQGYLNHLCFSWQAYVLITINRATLVHFQATLLHFQATLVHFPPTLVHFQPTLVHFHAVLIKNNGNKKNACTEYKNTLIKTFNREINLDATDMHIRLSLLRMQHYGRDSLL